MSFEKFISNKSFCEHSLFSTIFSPNYSYFTLNLFSTVRFFVVVKWHLDFHALETCVTNNNQSELKRQTWDDDKAELRGNSDRGRCTDTGVFGTVRGILKQN